MEQFESIYFRGQGKVFLADRDANGNPSNMIFLGDVSAFDITANVSRGSHLENVSGARSEVASWIDSLGYTLAITSHSIKPAHLAKIMQGAATAVTGTTVTAEEHTANLDAMVMLDHSNISAVTVTDVGGVTTFVEDTDYVVHAEAGLIEPLSTGSITEGETLEIDYTFADQTEVTTDPGNTSKYLVVAGKNTTNNDKQVRCEIYKAKLDPAAVSMISTGVSGQTLNATVERDTLRAAGDQFFKYTMED